MKLKKLLAMVLCVAIVLSTMSFTVFAEEQNYVAQIGDVEFETIDAAFEAAQTGDEVVILVAGEYSLSGISGKDITVTSTVDGVIFTNIGAFNMDGANVTFNNVTFTYAENSTYKGLQHAGNMVYKDCIFNGQVFLYGASETFNNCTFNQNSADAYNVWTYGAKAVEFNGCTFNSAGKSVLVYNEGRSNKTDLTVEKTSFNASSSVTGKAAIEIDTSLMAGATITIDADTTAAGFDAGSVSGSELWNDKKADSTKYNGGTTSVVIVAGETVKDSFDPAWVATVDGEPYTDIQEAIKAAAPGGTVEILRDIEVDKWIMFAESLSVANGNIITCNINGLTINGNNHTLTINSIESAGNGNSLFHDAQNLNINDLTIKYANGVAGGIGLQSGTISNVTFDGGVYGVLPGTGEVEITGCTFKTNGTSIYFESDRDNLVVTGNTFKNADTANVILLRGSIEFTNNTIISGRTVNVVSGSPVVTGNDFGEVRFKVYTDATGIITNNTINILAFDNDTQFKSVFAGNTLSADAQAALNARGAVSVARIGENYYISLTAAITAAQANDTIVLLADVSEDVTINKAITLDGAEKNYTGTMTISASINLTIDNVNFIEGNVVKGKNTGTSGTYIIKNCDFRSDSDDVYAIELRGTGSINIENCTSKGYFGFLQVPSSNDSVLIKDVTIDGTGYAIKVDYSNGVSLENVTITNSTYGFVNSNFGTKTITVKSCNIKADYPLVIWDRNTAKVNTFKFEGSNDFGTNVFYYQTVTEEEKAYTKYVLTENATLTAVEGLNVTTADLADYYVVKYVNGTYGVYDTRVAEINGTRYATLQAAIDAAQNGDTITIISDFELTAGVTVPAAKAITLDLNGKTVSMNRTEKVTANHTMISNSGNLTIMDSANGGTLSYIYSGDNIGATYAVNTVTSNPGSTLTVKGGTIENLTFDSSVIAYAIDGLTNGGIGDVTVNIEGGIITSERQSIRIFENSTTKTGTLKISGGDITGRVIVQNASANANKAAMFISGGTFNANDYKADVLYVGGSNGATMDVTAGLSISDGIFNGEVYSNVGGTFISGGTFSGDPAEYVAENYASAQNADGTYSVVPERSINVSANKEEVVAGEEVKVSVTLNGEGMMNADFELIYDPAKFELQSRENAFEIVGNKIVNKLFKEDKTAYDNGEVLTTYTFKAIAQTDVTTADFVISNTYAYTEAESLEGTKAATANNEKVTVTINLMDYSVVKYFDGAEYDGDSKELSYDGQNHTFKVTTVPPATITYKVNGDAVDGNEVVIKGEGDYEIEYTVAAPEIGYAPVSGTFTLTIAKPVYVVEITPDYVSGKSLVLVYTNVEDVFFKYDGNMMVDVTARGYLYEETTSYGHVFGFVTDNETANAARVSHLLADAGLYKILAYDEDLNFDNEKDLRDITTVYSVYNVSDTAFGNLKYQKNILKSDIERNKKVDGNDTAAVVNRILYPEQNPDNN